MSQGNTSWGLNSTDIKRVQGLAESVKGVAGCQQKSSLFAGEDLVYDRLNSSSHRAYPSEYHR